MTAEPLPPPRSPVSSQRPNYRARALLLVGVLLIVLMSLEAYFRRPSVVAATRALGARLDLVSGEVTIDEQGKSAKAISGTPLAVSSRVKTGAGARALIRTGDGTSLFLRGDTEIVLEAKSLSVERGEIWLDAPSGDGEREGGAITCRLGKHVVSASGAGLSVRRNGDDVDVYVARGLVILTSPGGRVEVNAGEQGAANATSAPKVSPVAFWADWTGGMGDTHPSHGAIGSGSGRIYGLDPFAAAGAPARPLTIAKQIVKVVLRDGLAETEVDQTFGNPGGRNIEGWYWFTVPEGAIVTSFALETDGTLVEGEVVEKHEAAAVYAAAMASERDPALLEWIDGRSYRARIFPIPANGTRRVVLRYLEVPTTVEGKLRYVYPMRSTDRVRFDELAISVDLGKAWAGRTVATSLDATIDDATGLVSMRRSGYVPRADFQLEISAPKAKPLRAWRFPGGADQADYVMVRYVPEVDFAKLPATRGEVVVVVDTSAGGDEASKQLRNSAAEAVLRTLADGDRFALVALDVVPTVVYPERGLALASEGEVSKALEKLTEHGVGGATDLGAMFEPALERLHGTEQPAVVYVGDGVTTSGETTPEALVERLRRSLSGSRARLFTVGTGPEARHDVLAQLARVGGGRHFRIDEADQTTEQALRLTSAIKMPTITDLEIDLGAGLDQPFYSSTGKLARGEELVLLARSHHALPESAHVKGRIAGQSFDTPIALDVQTQGVATLVPRLWANEYARRVLGSGTAEESRSKVLDLGLEYGLVTPFTSIIALDTEQAFARSGIKRHDTRLRGAKLSTIPSLDVAPSGGAASSLLFGAGPSAAGCSKSSETSDEKPSVSSVREHPASPPLEEKRPERDGPSPAAGADRGLMKEGAAAARSKAAGSEAKADGLSNQADDLSLKLLGSAGGEGPAVGATLPSDTASADHVDKVASDTSSVDATGGPRLRGPEGGSLTGGADLAKGGQKTGGPGGPPTSAPVAAEGPKVPTITTSEATTSAPNVPGADAVVAKNKWRFRGCYNKALQADPDAGGKVAITVTIDSEGKVTTASGSGGSPASLATCVAGTFYSMTFPAPDGGSATFKVSANFASKGDGDRARAPTPVPAPEPIVAPPKPPQPPSPRPIPSPSRCSDVASRPLWERIVLWRRRLVAAKSSADLITQYDAARRACELPDFRDRTALLQLLQEKISTEGSAADLLAHLAGEPESQQWLARAILRRTVDVRLAAVASRVLYGRVDWLKLDRELAEKEKLDDKLQALRVAMLAAPGDPSGEMRLIRLLVQKGSRQEAVSHGRRLRDRGLMTPILATQLGDVLAAAGEKDEALRTYSEMVEFDGDSPAPRRALGDVFLRQGWHAAAYRQYKTLTDLEPKSPIAWLRMATAAAGAGRVDEALRIEREVMSGEGAPGPNDPRQWARLWSATRLGVLLASPPEANGESARAAMSRKLKELSLFSGPGALALLTWEDLDARIVLATPSRDGKLETLAGETTDAGSTGLFSLLASREAWSKGTWVARWQADAPMGRAVKLRLVVISWDGKAYSVTVKPAELAGEAKEVGL
jgi:tetratricopeptide (TPR) repeat protein